MRIKQVLLSGFKSYRSQETFDDFHPRTNVLGTPPPPHAFSQGKIILIVSIFSWQERFRQVQPDLWCARFFARALALSSLLHVICTFPVAIRFVLSSDLLNLRAEERKQLIHVRRLIRFLISSTSSLLPQPTSQLAIVHFS